MDFDPKDVKLFSNRFRLPAAVAGQFINKQVVVGVIWGKFVIIPSIEFEKFLKEIDGWGYFVPYIVRRARRQFLSQFSEVTVDGKGRIPIDKNIKKNLKNK